MATTTIENPKAVVKETRSPEQILRSRAGLAIGRGVWLAHFKSENPNATPEERKAAWPLVRKQYKKIGMNALKGLEKNGFQVTEAPSKKSA